MENLLAIDSIRVQCASMNTMVIKKKKFEIIPGKRHGAAKVSKYAFGPAVRKMAGIVNTGIGNLSMREGFGD